MHVRIYMICFIYLFIFGVEKYSWKWESGMAVIHLFKRVRDGSGLTCHGVPLLWFPSLGNRRCIGPFIYVLFHLLNCIMVLLKASLFIPSQFKKILAIEAQVFGNKWKVWSQKASTTKITEIETKSPVIGNLRH